MKIYFVFLVVQQAQRFQEMAKYVVRPTLSFARNTILAEK